MNYPMPDIPFSSQLPQVFTYKYRIGDVFMSRDKEHIIRIVGYNTPSQTYKTVVTSSVIGKHKVEFENNFLSDYYLTTCDKYSSMEELKKSMTKTSSLIRYKIYYVDPNPNTGEEEKGQRAQDITLNLTGLKQLARTLNNMKKGVPNRRIIMVAIVDNTGKFLNHVRFLPQEIRTQKFLTGMKERLLAHAKYELNYEVSIGF